MSGEDGAMVKDRSMLKDFLASIATMTGDLSNITAPPFVLDTRSVIEIPAFWAENPANFVSPATSDDPAQRALLVLRSFLTGLKSQCYMGHSPEQGVKKPLNAFLGELFIGKWEDENGTTHMLGEQVSHHPPVTTCRVWNDKYGVIAEGYNRQTITFNGSVNVQCSGHILKSLTKYDEHYLLPIPDFKVKGVLSTPYPELGGTYHIPSNNGYQSAIHFSGKSLFSSAKKHSFEAKLYKEEQGESNPLFTVEGNWDTEFTIHDVQKQKDIEVVNIEHKVLKDKPSLIVDSLEEQDPWESRRAWQDTVTAIRNNDMKGVSDAKGQLEQGQREMREEEERQGKEWEPLFFKQSNNSNQVKQLKAKVPEGNFWKSESDTEGFWEFKPQAWKTAKKPYHGSVKPDNTRSKETHKANAGAPASDESTDRSALPARPKHKQEHPNNPEQIDHTIGAVDDGRPAEVNGTLVDVGRQPEARTIEGITKDQPEPQVAQMDVVHEHRGSGIEGMSVEQKDQIENMLRDQYSTASKEKKDQRAKRRSMNAA